MRKQLVFITLIIILAGCTGPTPSEVNPFAVSPEPTPETLLGGPDFKPVKLDDLGPAPELENEIWLNTDQPLRLADLRGKVVLLDMWTFG